MACCARPQELDLNRPSPGIGGESDRRASAGFRRRSFRASLARARQAGAAICCADWSTPSRSRSAPIGVGIAIGIGGAYGKLYGGPVVRDLLEVYTTIVRAVPELVLILLLYFAGTDLINRVLDGDRLRAGRHQRAGRRHRRARLRAGRLFDGGAARRHPRRAAGPDRGGARLRHAARPAAAAHHAAGDAAFRHSRPCQSLADRHQGHGAAGRRRLQRTDAGDAPGCRRDQGLFHLLRGGRRHLSHADAVLQRHHRAHRALGAARHAACTG